MNWNENVFVAGDDLRDIIEIPSGEAWAVGKGGTVIQYDGTVWSTLSTTMPSVPTNQELKGVWAISSTEVWVTGKNGSIYRWDGPGLGWSVNLGPAAGAPNNKEVRSAWGDASYFYAVQKEGQIFRYDRTAGTWDAVNTTCSNDYDMDVERIWGDGTGNIYMAGKDKDPNPDQAALFLYGENFPGPATCSIINSTTSADKFNGVAGNGSVV